MKKMLLKKQICLVSLFLSMGIFFGKDSTFNAIDRIPAQTSSKRTLYHDLENIYEIARKPEVEDLLGNWTIRCVDSLSPNTISYRGASSIDIHESVKPPSKGDRTINQDIGRLFSDTKSQTIPEKTITSLKIFYTKRSVKLVPYYHTWGSSSTRGYNVLNKNDNYRTGTNYKVSYHLKMYDSNGETFIIIEDILRKYSLKRVYYKTEIAFNYRDRKMYYDLVKSQHPKIDKNMCYLERNTINQGDQR